MSHQSSLLRSLGIKNIDKHGQIAYSQIEDNVVCTDCKYYSRPRKLCTRFVNTIDNEYAAARKYCPDKETE